MTLWGSLDSRCAHSGMTCPVIISFFLFFLTDARLEITHDDIFHKHCFVSEKLGVKCEYWRIYAQMASHTHICKHTIIQITMHFLFSFNHHSMNGDLSMRERTMPSPSRIPLWGKGEGSAGGGEHGLFTIRAKHLTLGTRFLSYVDRDNAPPTPSTSQPPRPSPLSPIFMAQ